MIDINNIPKELLDRISLQFDANPTVVQMRIRQQMLMRGGRFEEALDVARQIEELYNKCVFEYVKEAERQVERIDVSTMDMPLEKKEQMTQKMLVCFMCADVMKSSIQDMNSILQEYAKGFRVDMFDDMRQLMEMCESKLSYLQKNSGYLKDLVWGDKCDNMYDMMLSKARSIMNKRKNDPNWGKNTEKFNK